MKNLNLFFASKPMLQKTLFIAAAVLSVSSFITAPMALVLGILMVIIVGNPFEVATKKMIQRLLQLSVVGLGFGMNVHSALEVGKTGFLFTVVSIISVLILGFVLSKVLHIEKITGFLISSGTAICGGSAIAAVAPIVKAKPDQISIALGVVFMLNALALLIFPPIGAYLHLSQHDFGLWSAIAIHDTSSVVGAASKYGAEALQVATTVKLARALWIIPLSIFSVFVFKNKETNIKIPWFIGFFIVAMLINTYFPVVHQVSPYIVSASKAGLTLTLYLIGAGLSLQLIKNVGIKPLLLAVSLWVVISVGTLLVILY